MNILPSLPGRQFSSADLLNARPNWQQVGRMIAEQRQNNTPLDVMTLLAAILQTQKRSNAKFQPNPFDFAVYTAQQVLPENLNRSYLLIQNVGNGDLLVVHETGTITKTDYSASTNDLIVLQTRAVRIVAGGNYEPLVAPTNPITIFTLNAVTNGVVIEGA